MNKIVSNVLLAGAILIASLIFALSNRYKPSPVNESLVIDSWTGDIYDIQGNNLSVIHRNMPDLELNNQIKPDRVQ